MDILNGMNNGPRGQTTPTTGKGGGMSTMTMGLLALLAYKAYHSGALGNIFGTSPRPGGGANTTAGGGNVPTGGSTGGLMDWLRGNMGGLTTGAATGTVVTGGLTELVKRFQQNGYGHVADSWVKTGPNAPISPNELAKAAGAEDLDALAKEMGVTREQLLAKLSAELPNTVDILTPDGRIPAETDNEGDDDKEKDDDKEENEDRTNTRRQT